MRCKIIKDKLTQIRLGEARVLEWTSFGQPNCSTHGALSPILPFEEVFEVQYCVGRSMSFDAFEVLPVGGKDKD
jgi:hypothetical protein